MPEGHYYANRRQEVMPFVPQDAKKILEIGCGKGAFRQNFPKEIEYWGVEPHRQSAIVASFSMTKVLIGDVFSVQEQMPDDYFDLIICNDVIEHIADTSALMQMIRAKLHDTGRIAGSIPNVRHAEVLYNLLIQRDWNYQPSGVLDHTHLRFYTKNSIQALMQEHGFNLERLEGINLDLPWARNIHPSKIRAWQMLMGEDSRALQFGFCARKVDLPNSNGVSDQKLFTQFFPDQATYEQYQEIEKEQLQFRRQLEHKLEENIPKNDNESTCIYQGYCAVCNQHQHLTYDRKYSDGISINWRERLVCVGCNLNNRSRLAHMLLVKEFEKRPRCKVYLTEQITALAGKLENNISDLVCSEYVSHDLKAGSVTENHLRHEDLTSLSFDSSSFDVIGCFDVLEHIPNYQQALSEMARVLNANGIAIISAPFRRDLANTLVRATCSVDGKVTHLLEPEYHGDPIHGGEGALAYHHFGWDLLEACSMAGFATAEIRSYWSSDLGNIGPEQLFIVASK
jgi:2-polyprenyl-3-methyl-5-hydroxy-6-metoxy-1,4-benzoquinol methylase